MKKSLPKTFLLGVIFLASGHQALAQVDVEHRRVLSLQTGFAVSQSEEALSGFGAFWFNENHFPWDNAALRVIFAGIYNDAQLSYFVGGNPHTAIGAGLGGGLLVDGITPYRQGERLSHQEFDGNSVNARVFINQTIPNPTPLAMNVRATYAVSGAFYSDANSTQNFNPPDNFLTQQIMAEFRLGGIVPGLTAKRGAELYVAADANYRSGSNPFGPTGAPFPAHVQYDRLFGSIGGKIPIKATTLTLQTFGGLGEQMDELSAWKLGGNLVNISPFAYTLHGYYTRELFADDFGLANTTFSFPIADCHKLTGHLYGDYAIINQLDVNTGRTAGWHSYIGVGTGLGFNALWNTDFLVSYGYGVNAVRNGDRGGHEVGFALEKKF